MPVHKKYVFVDGQWEKLYASGGSGEGGGGGTEYFAGDNINIDSHNVISAVDTTYTAGDGIEITNANVINNLIDISNYYNKTEIQDLLNAMGNLRLQIVETLPAAGQSNVIYLVKRSGINIYDQWIYQNYAWANIGDTSVDLSQFYTKIQTDNLLADYYKKTESDANYYNKTDTYNKTETYAKTETYSQTEVDNIIADYYDKTEVDDLLDDKQDKLTDGTEITSPANSDFLSGVNLSTKKVHKVTFANIWNWIVGKASHVISNSSTHYEIPTSKGVYDYIDSLAKYLHIVTFYNTNTPTYPMASFYVITTNATETYATMATWLYNKGFQTIQTAYPWVSGVSGTKEVSTPSGTYNIGVPVSGAYSSDGTTIYFKTNYNGYTSPASDKFDVKNYRID